MAEKELEHSATSDLLLFHNGYVGRKEEVKSHLCKLISFKMYWRTWDSGDPRVNSFTN